MRRYGPAVGDVGELQPSARLQHAAGLLEHSVTKRFPQLTERAFGLRSGRWDVARGAHLHHGTVPRALEGDPAGAPFAAGSAPPPSSTYAAKDERRAITSPTQVGSG
jgi:hypothetical protein